LGQAALRDASPVMSEDLGMVGARGVAATLSMVGLTPSGQAEMLRLQQVGLARFATFVADWCLEAYRAHQEAESRWGRERIPQPYRR
jgi:hypothetical protein